jgi:hypothetical protein
VLALLDRDVRLKGATILGVLVSSQTVAYSVVADLADVPITLLLLDKVVLASHVDGEMLKDLG